MKLLIEILPNSGPGLPLIWTISELTTSTQEGRTLSTDPIISLIEHDMGDASSNLHAINQIRDSLNDFKLPTRNTNDNSQEA